MSVSVKFFISIALALLSTGISLNTTRTTTNTSLPEEENKNQSTADLNDLDNDGEASPNNTHLYKFIVRIVYSTKVHKLGILFRPRFVLAAYTKLYYYNELNIYVTAWADVNFRNLKLIRKIINAKTYTNRIPLCDFQLSLLEIESPFEGDQNYWLAPFMTQRKPEIGTPCKIIYFSLNRLYERDTRIADWDDAKCEDQLGYLYNCERETFVCFTADTPTEVDVAGSLVLCNSKIAAVLPGYMIPQVISVEYLPYYRKWFLENSDNLMQHSRSDVDVALGTYTYIVVFMIILMAK